jgi:hypothetical protein
MIRKAALPSHAFRQTLRGMRSQMGQLTAPRALSLRRQRRNQNTCEPQRGYIHCGRVAPQPFVPSMLLVRPPQPSMALDPLFLFKSQAQRIRVAALYGARCMQYGAR